MAVAPINQVRSVVRFAVGEIPPDRILMGMPNYGYDWVVGSSSPATVVSNVGAINIAVQNNAQIFFDETSKTPYFNYRDGSGRRHEVWFEDARSIKAKLALTQEYGLYGVGYWNLMRPFPQNWVVLNSLYHIREELSSGTGFFSSSAV